MILNTRRNSSPVLAKARLASIVSATSLIGVAALYCGPRFVLAGTPPRPPAVIVAPDTDGAPVPPAVVVEAPQVPVAIVAQADAPEPTPGVGPGPKFKPEPLNEDPAAPDAPDAPPAPKIGADAAPAPGPHVARAGKPGKTPPPEFSEDDSPSKGSIEERLRRVEKMVKELMAQQNPKHHGAYVLNDGKQWEYRMDQMDMDKLKASAERQAARAAEQAQRAAEEAKRATMDLKVRIDQQHSGQGEAFQRELEALRKARESLGQEMERLDRQIQKLEKQQQNDKEEKRRGEVSGQKLHALVLPAPAQP